MPRAQRFVRCKYGILTYAQCDSLDPFEVSDRLSTLGAECIIGREHHEDGGIHLHAFFIFERVFESTNVRIFDVGGYHPNVSNDYGTPTAAYDYAIKDGDVVAGGAERPSSVELGTSSGKWHEIISMQTDGEFFEALARLDPRALCCSYTSLRKYADWKYRTDPAPYGTPAGVEFDTSRVPRLDRWVGDNLGDSGVIGKLSYTFASSVGGGSP